MEAFCTPLVWGWDEGNRAQRVAPFDTMGWTIRGTDAAAVKQAVAELAALDAIETEGGVETLSPLGKHLSLLPVDVRIGKFILLGAIFGCVDETLTIAATLSRLTCAIPVIATSRPPGPGSARRASS